MNSSMWLAFLAVPTFEEAFRAFVRMVAGGGKSIAGGVLMKIVKENAVEHPEQVLGVLYRMQQEVAARPRSSTATFLPSLEWSWYAGMRITYCWSHFREEGDNTIRLTANRGRYSLQLSMLSERGRLRKMTESGRAADTWVLGRNVDVPHVDADLRRHHALCGVGDRMFPTAFPSCSRVIPLEGRDVEIILHERRPILQTRVAEEVRAAVAALCHVDLRDHSHSQFQQEHGIEVFHELRRMTR